MLTVKFIKYPNYRKDELVSTITKLINPKSISVTPDEDRLTMVIDVDPSDHNIRLVRATLLEKTKVFNIE